MVRDGGHSWKRALLIGLAIAAVPIVGLNALLAANLFTTSQREVDEAATEVLQIAEQKLDDAATLLISLGLKHVSTCSEADVEAMRTESRRAAFVSEVAVVDSSGSAECAAFGLKRVARTVSAEHGTIAPEVQLSAVTLGEARGKRLIRLQWRYADGRGLRVLVPGDRLLPQFLRSRLSASFVAQLVMIDGATIAKQYVDPALAQARSSLFPTVSASVASHRYPLRVEVEAPGGALARANGSLFLYGNLGGIIFAALTACVAVVASMRSGGPSREIHDAIRRGEFVPYYQPVIDIVSGKLKGCEVLARWRKPDGAVIPPGRFISLAEASGDIFPMTLALMETAREDLAEAYSKRPALKVGFNLFAGHFDDLSIVDDISRIFLGSPIGMGQLMLEVTERQPLQDIPKARIIIEKLQALGARVALDDVGTGHGGLSYLLKLGVDVMKMDKMFVDAIGTDRYSVAIIDSMVKLADDMNLDLIAEGVETLEQLEYLRNKGVRLAQGYVFAPPLPASAYLQLVAAMVPASRQDRDEAERRPASRGAARA